MFFRPFAGIALCAAFLLSPPALADDGHGHDAAPAGPAASALPRFSASSELFELVGVLDRQKLTVYLDRFEDNTPVKGAQIELDVGGAKVALQEIAEGEFEGRLARALPEGVTAVTATIAAGDDSDLLAGELDIHAGTHEDAAPGHGLRNGLGWGIGILAALAAIALLLRRTGAARRAGGAA